MSNMSMNYSAVEAEVKNIVIDAKSLADYLKGAWTTIERLGSSWDGNVFDKFSSDYKAILKVIESQTAALEKGSRELKQSAEDYQDAEDKMAKAAQSLTANLSNY